jgi:hypothetical protein
MNSDPNSLVNQPPIGFSYLTAEDWTFFRVIISTCYVTAARGIPPSVLFGQFTTDILRLRLERFTRMISDLSERNYHTGQVGFLVASLVVELASRGDFVMDVSIDSQYVVSEVSFKRV